MKVFRNIDEITRNENNILTVGTFDGVHLGHQHLFNELNKFSTEFNLNPILITIDPHPQIVLQRKSDFNLLTNIEERLYLFQKFGIQNVFVIPFDKEFAATPPKDFVKDYLFNKIGFSHILVGYDHFFGRNREGNRGLLDDLSLELGFKVDTVAEFENTEHKISSTNIRKLLLYGDFSAATKLLGHNYIIRGEIVVGDKRGRTIGLPTANIESVNSYKLIPKNGVYLVSAEIKGKKYFGMCNIGNRPTFTNGLKRTIETNFLDFDEEIYGEILDLEFYSFIREERKFESLDTFLSQIHLDKLKCQTLIEGF